MFNQSAPQRVPWKKQAEDRDCGAAAFASVASYYGHHVSVEEARDLVRTDRTGTTMRWICEGARSIGLNARGVRANFAALGALPLPTIVHLSGDDGHYFVLTAHSDRSVRVIDPNIGPMRLPREEFERLFSGFAIEFTMSDRFVERSPTFRPWEEAARQARKARPSLIAITLLIAAATAVGLLITQQLASAIDAILRGQPVDFWNLGALLAIAATAVSLAQLGRLWLIGRIGEDIDRDLGSRFLASIQKTTVRNFEERCPVAFGGRVAETEVVRWTLTDALSQLTSGCLIISIVLAVSTLLHPLLASVQLMVIPVMFLISLRTQSFGDGYRFLTRLVDTFTEFHTVKMFNAEHEAVQSLEQRHKDVAAARRSTTMARGVPDVMSGWLIALANTVVVVVVSWLAASGRITAGQAILGFGASGIGFAALAQIPALLVRWEAATISLERLLEIVHIRPEPNLDRPRAAAAHSAAHRITFDNVSFSYDGRVPVLDGFSAVIEPGETVAIVGTTGSGKTSLARLAAALEQPTDGEIYVGDLHVRTAHPADVRSRLAVVFQDTRLMQRSLWENLTIGIDDPDPAAVHHAIEMAGLTDVIAKQRLGLQTHAARAGSNFSSGQGQRFALARALLHDPDVLFLDEATGNIDSAVESQVLSDVLASRKGRTTVLTAHRFVTVQHADRVIVLEDGRAVETGTPAELAATDSAFRRLFAAQLDASGVFAK